MTSPFAYQSQPPVKTEQQPDREAFMAARESVGEQKLKAAMQAIVAELQAEATRRVGLRQTIEDRWIEDLEQYHSRYPFDTERNLKAEERSRLFINMTQSKTDAMGNKLKDLLFPTDERNWGIGPTPVPTLTEKAEKAASQARMLDEQAQAAEKASQAAPANDNGGAPAAPPVSPEQAAQVRAQANDAKVYAAKLQGILDEARRRSDLMQDEIDDQLTECNYQAVCRDQIDWAVKIGTGIIKGPVTGDRIRRGWKQDQNGQHYLDMAEGNQPGYRLVDPFSYFPDPDVSKVEDGQGDYERHLFNPKKLRNLQKLPGFDVDALRRLLSSKPIAATPAYISQLRNIRAEAQDVTGPLYQVWEYNGCLEPEQMRTLALAFNNATAFNMVADVDPLTQVNACVWFCDGEVLKFALYPYESGECMYSTFCLVKDESSVFGYGMPAKLRDLQSAFNAGWRTMMDNAGISSGPQIVVDKSSIEPADGDWKLRPRKIWYGGIL